MPFDFAKTSEARMPGLVYILCAVTALASCVLLARAAWRGGGRLLLLSSVAFAGLALNNGLLYLDRVIAPNADWSLYPNIAALASVSILLIALIWDAT
jgi:hypothetical protein